ncbi:MAG: M17 family metallopeptidase [Betaproteobacteria bacterium]|nr:M17 family metallopeptidase [Betaproteobacteria bacterium]
MLAQLAPISFVRNIGQGHSHVFVIMPRAESLPEDLPGKEVLEQTLARQGKKAGVLAKTPLCATAGSALVAWAMDDSHAPRFARAAHLRKAMQPLLDEKPERLCIAVLGSAEERAAAATLAAEIAWINSAPLLQMKSKPEDETKRRGRTKDQPPETLHELALCGWRGDLAAHAALAQGNTLARALTQLPQNILTPEDYRKRIKRLALQEGWTHEEYNFVRLEKMGAGAFCAVARGSQNGEAAIVHLSCKPSRNRTRHVPERIALVGKGICFDTGGHNLKPPRAMLGMHEDMAGSAVALGLLLTASRLQLPLEIEVWLALARNHLGPQSYAQGDIVTALDGTTIEVVHTDAEGRMALADALCLAARKKPDLMIDFATLTGSMITALGTRYSGVFASDAALGAAAVAAGQASGERVQLFPFDEDYEEALESKVADIRQCAMEGEADHILAARFLRRFAGEGAWLHLDLSAANCKGGLGAVASDITGFGVAWGLALLQGRVNS